ncbi:iron-siderophore ABC transporter substrate-binding protein [Chroococcidiopsis sp. CCMEE 29]|uniref:ABC transporter substrate-binding protein n=1 Tax=Chroococcidiopsis sp. CCMEE 29 TaxID=155894 RepID=UPI00202125C5|nr:iron-siderophore ABC transporter substrate-binding protein [Chroococcidiopsis sp. CCMEE 29]
MTKKVRRAIKLSLLGVIALVVVSACSGKSSHNGVAQSNTISSSSPAATRVVKSAVGEIRVPVKPQRVVTPSPCTMESALALGVKPVGGSHWNWKQPYLQGKVEGIEDVGWIPNPSLEKILALKPDLILDTVYHQQMYSLLSQIAPTFLAYEKPEGSRDWKEVFAQIAEALGKTEVAKQVMADYYARLEKFKVQMSERLKETEVSVVAIYQDQISLYMKADFSGTILEDAGLSRPPSQNLERKGMLEKGSYAISRERFRDIDSDVMFLITGDDDPVGQTRLKQLKADPLWSQLKVVQQGKVYEVRDYWLGCSPLAANTVIDDLFTYLLSKP